MEIPLKPVDSAFGAVHFLAYGRDTDCSIGSPLYPVLASLCEDMTNIARRTTKSSPANSNGKLAGNSGTVDVFEVVLVVWEVLVVWMTATSPKPSAIYR